MEKNNNTQSFMDMFLDDPQYETTEYNSLEEQYVQMFGHPIPREMMPSIPQDQLDEALAECISKQEDLLLKLLNIEIKDDVIY